MIAGRFLQGGGPPLDRVLLVESGSRSIAEAVLPQLFQRAPQMQCDVLTCFGGRPAGLKDDARVYSVLDYPDAASREKLFAQLRQNGYGVVAILCSAEPIMTKWKWAVAWKVVGKVLIINENADFFWFDRTNWRLILHFILFRADLTGGDAVRTLLRLALFPLSVAYLVFYAGAVHLRRRLRFG